ncbi:SPFH domain-containing protein [Mycobacterium sp.]|uniref:SPFH domain-containing protein n=1 Tax=Mycobacterium sp. TaxID=1785 RepID=UPI003BB00F30
MRLIIPFIDVLHRISVRVVTMPTQSRGIITRDNVSADVSAVAYVKVVDAVKSVVDIEVRPDKLACGGVAAFMSLRGLKRCVYMSGVFDE